MQLTPDLLKKVYPHSSAKNRLSYAPLFNRYMPEYAVTTPIRVWSYLAQVGHESGELNYVRELASGEAYDTGKLAVALGNTPEDDDDGRKYKGRGLIQITGNANYQALSNFFGVDFIQQPELLEEPEWAVKSSLWYWKTRKLNEVADTGDFKLLTKRINGGFNGLAERQKIYDRCKLYL